MDKSMSDIQAAPSSEVDKKSLGRTIEKAVERGSHHESFALYARSN
jgi:hypothetical protein